MWPKEPDGHEDEQNKKCFKSALFILFKSSSTSSKSLAIFDNVPLHNRAQSLLVYALPYARLNFVVEEKKDQYCSAFQCGEKEKDLNRKKPVKFQLWHSSKHVSLPLRVSYIRIVCSYNSLIIISGIWLRQLRRKGKREEWIEDDEGMKIEGVQGIEVEQQWCEGDGQ